MTVKVKTVRKLGFFSALSILLGTVVGIGIFFKNHSILRGTEWSGSGTLVAWILGGVLALCAAVSFSEIGNMRSNKSTGIGEWAQKTCGRKFGYFTRFTFSIFYLGMLTSILGVFGSEALINVIVVLSKDVKEQPDIWVHILVGVGLTLFFYILSYVSIHTTGIIQLATTIIKFIPLIMVGLAGIIMLNTNAHPATASTTGSLFGQNAFNNGRTFSVSKMLSVLPAVLFAFDGFLNVGGMSKRVKGGEQRTSIIVVIGMLIIMALYLLIAISAILHGSGMVTGAPLGVPPAGVPTPSGNLTGGFGIFDQIFKNPHTAEVMGKIVTIFIAISTLGVVNGVCGATQVVISQEVENELIIGSRALKRKVGTKRAGLIIGLAIVLVGFMILGIPAIVLNSDSIIDGISNFPTLFMFALYVPIIFAYAIKRNSFENQKMNKALFYTVASIAVVGITLVVAYQLLFHFPVAAAQEAKETTHWGLFVGDGEASGKGQLMNNQQGLIVFLSMLALFISLPILNFFAIKKFEKRNLLKEGE